MNILDTIASKIIKEQELIIGPVAWNEAEKVTGLTIINVETGELSIHSNDKKVIDQLVNKYEVLFGRASREVCKEAVINLISELPSEEIPDSLK